MLASLDMTHGQDLDWSWATSILNQDRVHDKFDRRNGDSGHLFEIEVDCLERTVAGGQGLGAWRASSGAAVVAAVPWSWVSINHLA